MRLFKYVKELSETQQLKREFLSPYEMKGKNVFQEDLVITQISTGPNCLKK